LRIFESDREINIVNGGAADDALVFEVVSFRHQFNEKGYEEEVAHRQEAQAISVKIAMAVAMADGTLDDAEGETIKHWIERQVAVFSEEKAAELKVLFNDTLKEAYKAASSGDLLLSDLVDRLSVLDMKKSNYDAVELCLDVMAADGVAEPEEMTVIRNVARGLGLDMDEIEKMREKVTLNLSSQLGTQEGLEALVGIEESWSNEDKKKHLRKEFQKWSNRLGSLAAGDEKDSAQAMLDNIATLRKKYE
jgi:tellurite resistance protein